MSGVDPKRLAERFLSAYSPPASEMPGVKTLVTPKSEQNLPTDIDREPDSNLPPGSATPNSPKPGGGGGGGSGGDANRGQSTRDLPEAYYGKPDGSYTTLKEKQRSQTEEGEQHGNPTKYDYNMPTRGQPTQRAAAWERRLPISTEEDVQVFSLPSGSVLYHGTSGQEADWLRENGFSDASRSAAVTSFSTDPHEAYRYAGMKREGQVVEVDVGGLKAVRIAEGLDWDPDAYDYIKDAAVRDGALLLFMEGSSVVHLLQGKVPARRIEGGLKERFPKKRQRKQVGAPKTYSHRWYMRNRGRHKNRALARYRKLKNNSAFKRDREMRRKFPQRFKRRRASSGNEITFVIGKDHRLGWLDGVGADGSVWYTLDTGETGKLPLVEFLSSTAFTEEGDIESFFAQVDEHVMTYKGITPEAVHGAADLWGIAWDNNETFLDRTEELTGKRHLDDLSEEELELVADAIHNGDFDGMGQMERVGMMRTASVDKEAIGAYRSTTKRRKKWRGVKRSKGRQYERRRSRSPKRKAYNRVYNQRRNRDPRVKYQRKLRRRQQSKWRKRGEVLTAPEIHFLYGPGQDDLGILRSVSPITAMVTFSTTKKDAEPLMSVHLAVFLESIVPMSEEDGEAMFDLLEAELGQDFYDELDFTIDDLMDCARLFGRNVDSSHFKSKCKDLIGHHDLESASTEELALVNSELVTRLEGTGFTRGTDTEQFEDKGDAQEVDPSDDEVYFGEVDRPPESGDDKPKKTAEAIVDLTGVYAGGGGADTFTYNQEAPNKEVPNTDKRKFEPTSPTHWRRQPKDKSPGHNDVPDIADYGQGANPPSGRVTPGGEGQFVYMDGYRAAACADDWAALAEGRAARVARTFKVEVGQPIWYGKYKNKRGVIKDFKTGPKGDTIIVVEQVPNPTGRKQPKEMKLFKIRPREVDPEEDGEKSAHSELELEEVPYLDAELHNVRAAADRDFAPAYDKRNRELAPGDFVMFGVYGRHDPPREGWITKSPNVTEFYWFDDEDSGTAPALEIMTAEGETFPIVKSKTTRPRAQKAPPHGLRLRLAGERVAAPEKYKHINFKPPESVAKAAEKGLEYRQKASPSNRGGLTTEEAGKEGIGSGVQRAVNLKNRNTISPDTVRQMGRFFARHEKNKNIAEENKATPWNDKGYVAWLLWGGDPGKSWVSKIIGQMDAADEKAKKSAGWDFDDFDDLGEDEELSPEAQAINTFESEVGLSQTIVLDEELVRDRKVIRMVGGRAQYVSPHRAWFVYADIPSSQARRLGARLFRSLVGRRNVPASLPALHQVPLWVGANDGSATRIDPPRKTASTPRGPLTSTPGGSDNETILAQTSDYVLWLMERPAMRSRGRPRKEWVITTYDGQYVRNTIGVGHGAFLGFPKKRDALEAWKVLTDGKTASGIEALWNWAGEHKDQLPGGLADKKKPGDFDQEQLAKGVKVEMEHVDDEALAREIAMDHLAEDAKYYDKLEQIEGNHTAAASGQENEPTNPELWEKVQKLTKGEIGSLTHGGKTVEGPNDGKGFDIFPSAYANGWAAKTYKELGGGWKKKGSHLTLDDLMAVTIAELWDASPQAREAAKSKKDVGKGGLDEWFSGHGDDSGEARWGDWVAISPVSRTLPSGKKVSPGEIVGPCGISDDPDWKEFTNDGDDPLKCMPRQKAHDMPKSERAELAKKKQRAEKKDKGKGKAPTRTETFKKKEAGEEPRTAATLMDLASRTGDDVHARSREIKVSLFRANPQQGMWLFNVRGRTANYRVRIKGIRKGNVARLLKAQVQVSCSCPFWRWQGPEHWGKVNGYLYGRPRGTATYPKIMDPPGHHWACKHVLACIKLARNYRFGSEAEEWLNADTEIIPVAAPIEDMWDEPHTIVAGTRFRDGRSPLYYRRAKGDPVHRISLCDSSVTEPGSEWDEYFKDLDPCVVAFLDYHSEGQDRWYLDYVNTRDDKVGKGYARKLVEEFFKRHAKPGVEINWGQMAHRAVGRLRDQMERRYPQVNQPGWVDYD